MDENDHRVLGQKLDLWHIQEDAPGMVFWHPKGHALFRVLEDHIRERMRRLGFGEIRTPQLMPHDLWVRSGHAEKFGANRFAFEDGDRRMALKPMSCPCHIQVFNQGIKSWRDLPVRYAEFGSCHRNEPSGSLHGLMRTRAFVQDDAHVLCAEEHVRNEVSRFVRLLSSVYVDLGFPSYKVALSTRPAVRAGDDGVWDRAEAALEDAAKEAGIAELAIQPGEGAFYGPKLEFILKDGMGREWQCGTVQLDMVLPGRLDASYVDQDGKRSVPLMLHHAVLGSMERFIGMLLEHHEGKLPFWLSPEQVAVLPISEKQADAARKVHDAVAEAGLRPIMLDGADTLSRRIVEANARAVPVVAVIGNREAEAGSVALRERDGSQCVLPLLDALASLRDRRA